MMLPLVAFPICGLLDLFCIYHELKAVQLRSLNRERAEMVAQHWLEQGKVRGVVDAGVACGCGGVDWVLGGGVLGASLSASTMSSRLCSCAASTGRGRRWWRSTGWNRAR